MTSSGPNMHAVIEQAAIKVNASVDKVKVSYFKLCLIVLADHAVAYWRRVEDKETGPYSCIHVRSAVSTVDLKIDCNA